MNTAQVAELLELIGVEEVKIVEATNTVRACCPFARWRHERNNDRRTSFRVNIPDESLPPTFSCRACGAQGTLPDLVYELQTVTGKQYPEAFMIFFEMPWMSLTTREPIRRRIRVAAPPPKAINTIHAAKVPVPNDALEEFPLLEGCNLADAQEVIDWLHHENGILHAVMKRHRLRLYVDPLIGDLGVALPIINSSTGLIEDLWTWLVGGKKAHRVQFKNRKEHIPSRPDGDLFGLECVTRGEPLFLMQNPLGAMKLESLRLKNIVVTLGNTIPDLTTLNHAPSIYVAMDDTLEGRLRTKQAIQAIGSPRIFFLRWSNVKKANGRCLNGPDELENFQQFKGVFEKRIILRKG